MQLSDETTEPWREYDVLAKAMPWVNLIVIGTQDSKQWLLNQTNLLRTQKVNQNHKRFLRSSLKLWLWSADCIEIESELYMMNMKIYVICHSSNLVYDRTSIALDYFVDDWGTVCHVRSLRSHCGTHPPLGYTNRLSTPWLFQRVKASEDIPISYPGKVSPHKPQSWRCTLESLHGRERCQTYSFRSKFTRELQGWTHKIELWTFIEVD